MEIRQTQIIRDRAPAPGNPLDDIGELRVLWTGELLDGPLWNPGTQTLLFTEIGADTIHELTLPERVEVVRRPSNRACGIAWSCAGELLVAESAARRITATRNDGRIAIVAERFEGKRFNAPIDLVVDSDDTIYFTDVVGGLPEGEPREIDVNAIYRVTPGGEVVCEWWGDDTLPSGILLGADNSLLYVSDAERDEVRIHDVLAGGSLSGPTLFCEVERPGGMCFDGHGNLYVAAAGGVHVFTPEGRRWGVIELDEDASNVSFGVERQCTLFITSSEHLYAVDLAESWLAPDTSS